MTWLAIAAVLTVMAAGVARLTRMALRSGHLLVLRRADGAPPAEVRVRVRGPRV